MEFNLMEFNIISAACVERSNNRIIDTMLVKKN